MVREREPSQSALLGVQIGFETLAEVQSRKPNNCISRAHIFQTTSSLCVRFSFKSVIGQ